MAPEAPRDFGQALLDLFGPVTLGRLAAASCQLHNRALAALKAGPKGWESGGKCHGCHGEMVI